MDLFGSIPHTNKTRMDFMTLPLASEQDAGGRACDYGALPGSFDREESAGKRWQIMGPRPCRLSNLLMENFNATSECPSPTSRPRVILSLGDSTDREVGVNEADQCE